MEPAVRRDTPRGLGVLDLVVMLALLALLVWLVRMDWAGHRRLHERAEPTAVVRSSAAHRLTRSSWMLPARSSSSSVVRL